MHMQAATSGGGSMLLCCAVAQPATTWLSPPKHAISTLERAAAILHKLLICMNFPKLLCEWLRM